MATHSSISAWKIPWTEDPGRLQSMGLQSQTRLSNNNNNKKEREYSGLISFRMDWFDLLAAQGTLKSLLQDHSSKHQFFNSISLCLCSENTHLRSGLEPIFF